MSIDQFPKDVPELLDKIGEDSLEYTPEQMVKLKGSINDLLRMLEPYKTVDCGSGFSINDYRDVIRCDKGFLRFEAAILNHKQTQAPVQYIYFSISRGSTEVGPGMFDDFEFILEETLPSDGQVVIKDDGEVVRRSHISVEYADTKAIDARSQEILEDETFNGVPPSGVILPSFKVTPVGDIYEAGAEVVDRFSPASLPELAIASSFRFDTEEDAVNFQRHMAAHSLATEQVGTKLTEGRLNTLLECIQQLKTNL